MKKTLISALTLATFVSAQSSNIPPNNETTKQDKASQKPSFMSAKDKSGFLLGVEANFGQNRFNQHFSFTPNVGTLPDIPGVEWIWKEGVYMQGDQSERFFGFDGGIKIGYQHYFTQEYGLRVSVYGGVGNPINVNAKADMSGYQKKPLPDKPDPSNPEKAIPFINYEAILKTAYLPIRVAIDIDFLYDFFNRGNHTLGLTTGIGYRFGYYLNQNGGKFSGRAQSNYPNPSTNPQQPITYSNTMANLKMENFITHDLYPQIGLHYYLGNHQFEFLFRFSGFLDFQPSKGKMIEIKGSSGEIYRYKKAQVSNVNPVSINYMYRF